MHIVSFKGVNYTIMSSRKVLRNNINRHSLLNYVKNGLMSNIYKSRAFIVF
jgi:hypothetical protein